MSDLSPTSNSRILTRSVLKQLARIKQSVSQDRVSLRRESNLVFICGAGDSAIQSGRSALFQYAKKRMPLSMFFSAEDALNQLLDKNSSDLLTMEEQLADYADCILLVLESPGAIAELGAFALSDKLVKSMLVVVDKVHITTESFITRGPLAKIARESAFGAAIPADLRVILLSISEIENRLQGPSARKGHRRNIEITTAESLSKAEGKIRMLFILDLIGALTPVRHSELISALKAIYGEAPFNINMELGLAESIGLLYRKDGYMLRAAGEEEQFLKYSFVDFQDLRASAISSIRKHAPDRIKLLVDRANDHSE